MSNISAIDKLRNLIDWLNWHNEDFNQKVKSISDFEKLYNYSNENQLDYLYEEYLHRSDLEDAEILHHKKQINKLIGYELYNL